MLLIMMILLSVSVSLFIVKKDTVNYTVVTVLGKVVEVNVMVTRNYINGLLSKVVLVLNTVGKFRGPPDITKYDNVKGGSIVC